MAEPALYPLFLKLRGRTVLVVGAGAVAARKIADLCDAGASVRVVAPEAALEIRGRAERGEIDWRARAFEVGDLDGAWLVVAATDDAAVQSAVAAACDEAKRFVIAVDDVPNASAYSGGVVRRAPFTIAISSQGETPALTRLLREILEQVLPEEAWVDAARALREKWRAEKTPFSSRFGELVRAFKERGSG